MRLTRANKEQVVEKMTQSLANTKTVVLVNYQGLKVKEIHGLKKKLLEHGIHFEILKNSLFRIVLKNAEIVIDDTVLDQPVAAIWGSQDEIIPAKLTVEESKTLEKLEVVGGIINKVYADVNSIKQLAALPGRDELYGKLVGTLNAPMYRLVNALQGNLRALVSILDQYSKMKA